MDTLIYWAILGMLGLLGLTALLALVFAIRNLTYGKVSPITMVIILIPLALGIVLGLITGDWIEGGILTMLIMLGLAAASLLLSGARGLFGF